MVQSERLRLTVVTATGFEYAQTRRILGSIVNVVRAGIRAHRTERIAGTAISCGVAGGLRHDLPTGTVVIPSTVRNLDGGTVACEPALTNQLRDAARRLGCAVIQADLLTTPHFVHRDLRKEYAAQGCAAVDMETALIDADAIVCVRVVLDTPDCEISPAWLNLWGALVSPSAWRDLPFLMKNGPRCARTAAEVIAEALR